MNLHIKERPVSLEVIDTFVFGGNMYSLDSTEDKDIMVIYKPSKLELLTPFNNHHVFQYTTKSPPEDRIYTTPQKFFANLANGDSLVNFEIFEYYRLNRKALFYSIKEVNFITKKLLRALLGFLKKDIKKFYKENTVYEKNKCLRHINRGYRLFQHLLNYPESRDYIPIILTTEDKLIREEDLKNLTNSLKSYKKQVNESGFSDYITIKEQLKITKLCNSLGFSETNGFDYYFKGIFDANINPQIKYGDELSPNKQIIKNIVK